MLLHIASGIHRLHIQRFAVSKVAQISIFTFFFLKDIFRRQFVSCTIAVMKVIGELKSTIKELESDFEVNLEVLTSWNDKVDHVLSDQQSFEQSVQDAQEELISLGDNSTETCKMIVETLHKVLPRLLEKYEVTETLHRQEAVIDSADSTSMSQQIPHHELAANDEERLNQSDLLILIQAMGFFVRWFIQIVAATEAYNSSSHKLQETFLTFKTKDSLQVYQRMMNAFAVTNPELARYTLQLSFYSIYFAKDSFYGNPIHENDFMSCLRDDLCFHEQLLILMHKSTSLRLLLSVCKNVHGVTSLFPQLQAIFRDLLLDSEANERPVWLQEYEADQLAYNSTFVEVAHWVVNQLLHSTCDDNDFTNESMHERWQVEVSKDSKLLYELLNEIFSCLFTLKFGKHLTLEENSATDAKFTNIIKVLFSDKIRSNSSIKRCRIQLVSVIMDASTNWMSCIATELPVLLQLLDDQICELMEAKGVCDAASASVLPILILFQKLSANPVTRSRVKTGIFPNENEAEIRQKIAELKEQKIKNVKPLDAPKDTLRWRLLQLLKWPHDHIKFVVGELLWILCNQDPQEFSYRVGIGNGLPLLASKGFATLPQGAG